MNEEILGLAARLARTHHMQFINLNQAQEVNENLLSMLRIDIAKAYRAIVINKNGNDIVVVIDDPTDTEKMDNLREYFDPYNVTFYISTVEHMTNALERYYSSQLTGAY